MRIEVDFDLCESNAQCMEECPEVFFVNDDEMLEVYDDKVTDALAEKLRAAAGRCPRRAITLIED